MREQEAMRTVDQGPAALELLPVALTANSLESRLDPSNQELWMDPLIFIAGLAFGLLYVLDRHRPRVRLSDAHAARRQRIVESWRERDGQAIARAQKKASTNHTYGPLTETQREVYRDVHERLDDLKKAA